MSSSFIVIDEIEEALNSVSSTLTTSIANVKSVVDTINTNVNTVKTNVSTILTNTNANNTASTSGTLSQKISSAISNTAATTTENSSGTLSAKLTYLINRRDRLYSPSSSNLKTVTTSLSAGNTTRNKQPSQGNRLSTAVYSGYTGYTYFCFDGIYRIYCTGTATVVNLENGSYGPTDENCLLCEVSVNDTVVANFTVATQGASKGTCASTTATRDVAVKKGDRIRFRIAADSIAKSVFDGVCSYKTYISNEVSAQCTEISIRGSIKETTAILY